MAALLGIDVGSKTLGVAVCDEGGSVAFPVTTIKRKGMRKDIATIVELAEDRGVREVVVGLPLEMAGGDGKMAGEARAVGGALEKAGLGVHYEDERLTTASAERMLISADVSRRRRKQVVDKIAATLILQSWLDRRQARSSLSGSEESP